MNDMERAFNCHLLLYADDSALIVSGKDINIVQQSLEKELFECSEWLVDDRLSLHLCKTESIFFASKNKLKPNNKLDINC